jgi:hypothetical protein
MAQPLTNTENLFDTALVDSVFQDGSIPLAKLVQPASSVGFHIDINELFTNGGANPNGGAFPTGLGFEGIENGRWLIFLTQTVHVSGYENGAFPLLIKSAISDVYDVTDVVETLEFNGDDETQTLSYVYAITMSPLSTHLRHSIYTSNGNQGSNPAPNITLTDGRMVIIKLS